MDGTQLVSSRAHAYACKLLSICRMAALDACQPASLRLLAQRHQNRRIAARSAAAVIISPDACVRACPCPWTRFPYAASVWDGHAVSGEGTHSTPETRTRDLISPLCSCSRANGRTDERTDSWNDGEERADAAGRGPDAMLFKHGLCEEVTSAPRYPPHYSNSYGAARTDSGFGVRASMMRSWKRNDHLEGGRAFPELVRA